MGDLVRAIREARGRSAGTGPHLPYSLGLGLGYLGDLAGAVTRLSLPINSERVRKFCAHTAVNSDRIRAKGFQPEIDLRSALLTTIEQEFGSR